jgi:peptide deformylase
LSDVCDPVVELSALGTLIDDMFDTMYAAPGRGLAAPQVGVLARLFVMDPTWKDGEKTPFVCINPVVTWSSDTPHTGQEACLSIPDVSADVTRSSDIRLAYTDRTGARHEDNLTGFAAICAQHELDHLDGLVIFDRLPAKDRETLEMTYEAIR